MRGSADDAILMFIVFLCLLLFIGEPDLWDKLMALLDHTLEEKGIQLPTAEEPS